MGTQVSTRTVHNVDGADYFFGGPIFGTNISADTLSEDEDDAAMSGGDGLCISESTQFSACDSDFVPTPGGPFSALTPSMWPQDILHRLSNPVKFFSRIML